ncbi:MAG: hypothetical protein WCI73_16410, partial [Phycisphaerae bacterium]
TQTTNAPTSDGAPLTSATVLPATSVATTPAGSPETAHAMASRLIPAEDTGNLLRRLLAFSGAGTQRNRGSVQVTESPVETLNADGASSGKYRFSIKRMSALRLIRQIMRGDQHV